MTQPATVQPPFPPAEIVKVSGPQGLAAAVPYLLGFHPAESIVLLCMRGPRRRMGPILRMDFPAGPAASRATAKYLAAQAGRHATAVALLCYTEEANGRTCGKPVHPRSALIGQCLAELREVGVPVFDAMLVRGNLIWSYLQHNPEADGYPLPEPGDPKVGHLHSAQVGAGRAVLADRAALAETIAGPIGIAAARAEEQIRGAATRFADQISDLDHQQTVALGCRIADERLAACWAAHRDGRPLQQDRIADLIAVMLEANIRDSVISWALQRTADEPLPMFIDIARWTPDEMATQVCAVLAAVAYRHGDGALAQLAVDRALAAEPGHRLAGVMLEMFNSGIRPVELDRLILAWPDHPANPAAPRWHRIDNEGPDQDQPE